MVRTFLCYASPGTQNLSVVSNGGSPVFVGSLPIPIKFARRPQVLSLASYQPQTAIRDRLATSTIPSSKKTSADALRKAAYAERDRSRSIDPGALDFAAEEDEEEDEDHHIEEDTVRHGGMADAGDRGRKRALKILQAGSEVPEAGMWRSLAT